jgi:predicted small metal-binding protein
LKKEVVLLRRKEEGKMAQKEYRQLSCRDVGADCDFMVRAETADEVMSLAGEHACRSHNVCEVTPELKSKVEGSIKTVWCDGACHDEPRKETGRFRWGQM